MFYIFVISGSRRFCQGVGVEEGSNYDNVFSSFSILVDKGREDANATKSRSSTARQRNAIKMACRWRADDGPIFKAGLVDL